MVNEKFGTSAECWKTPSWERNISEHDITEHTQITTEKYLFLYHKLWLEYEIDINRLILVR